MCSFCLPGRGRRRASESPRSPRKKRRHSRSPNILQGVVQDVHAGLDSRFELLGIDGDQDVALINFERAKEVLGDSCEYPRLHRSACYFSQSAAQLWVLEIRLHATITVSRRVNFQWDFVERIKFFLEVQVALSTGFSQTAARIRTSRQKRFRQEQIDFKFHRNWLILSRGNSESLRKSSRALWHSFRIYRSCKVAFVTCVVDSPPSRTFAHRLLVYAPRIAGSVIATLVLLPYSIGRPRGERERHGFGEPAYSVELGQRGGAWLRVSVTCRSRQIRFGGWTTWAIKDERAVEACNETREIATGD